MTDSALPASNHWRQLKSKTCAACGIEFTPNNPRRIFCSVACRNGKKNCVVCGTSFILKGNTTGKYCSSACWYKEPGKRILPDRTCKTCGTEFVPGTATQGYCCTECKVIASRKPREVLNCLTCEKPLVIVVGNRTRKFCSRACALTGGSRRGITRADLGDSAKGPNGYRLVKVGPIYEGAYRNGWALEHRVVMEQSLGRSLLPSERVHHRNGQRNDNRIENLELWLVPNKKDPAGQRVEDLLVLLRERLSALEGSSVESVAEVERLVRETFGFSVGLGSGEKF